MICSNCFSIMLGMLHFIPIPRNNLHVLIHSINTYNMLYYCNQRKDASSYHLAFPLFSSLSHIMNKKAANVRQS